MKVSPKVFQFALGTILAAAGVVLISGKLDNSVRPNIAGAQTGLNYTAEWNAEELITVSSSLAVNGGNVLLSDVPIGVAKWSVTGRQTGTQNTLFTETWTVPNVDVTFNNANVTNGTFNPSEWLYASFVSNGGSVGASFSQYKIANISILGDPNRPYTFRGGLGITQSAIGNSVRCQASQVNPCLNSTGAYGWLRHKSGTDQVNYDNSDIKASGLMMPLKWTVNGTIN